MYNGKAEDNAYKVLERIFLDCNYPDYHIDENLKNIYLNGYIPVCTHKQALQQIAFVCGCLVYDNRGSPISIESFNTSLYQEI